MFEQPRFAPLQLVRVVLFGFKFDGRVASNHMYAGHVWVYSVEYRQEDEIKSRDFYADELGDCA